MPDDTPQPQHRRTQLVTARLPIPLVRKIEALQAAQCAGAGPLATCTRNSVLTAVIEAGLRELGNTTTGRQLRLDDGVDDGAR